MKKKLVFVYLLLAAHCIIASEKPVPGCYINSKGDSVKCIILLNIGFLASEPEDIAGQNQVDILTSDNKRLKLLADTIKALVITSEKEKIYIVKKNTFGFHSFKGKYVFFEFLLNDYFKLYVGRYNSTIMFGPNKASSCIISEFYYQKDDSSLIQVNPESWVFKKQISSLMFDNPEIVNKVRSYSLDHDNTFEIFNKYCQWKKNASANNDTLIHYTVDISPIFDGRDIVDLNYYFKPCIKWPRKLSDSERIIIWGIVEKDGRLTNIQVKGFKEMPELNDKFLEVAQTMNKWTPALHNGEIVRTPVTFIIKY